MKKKENVKILGIIGLLLICIMILPMISFGASSKKGDAFDIKAEYGYNGEGKYGRTVPVSLEITSLTDDFEGNVKLIINNNSYDEEATAYITELMLPAGGEKKVSFLLPSLANYSKLMVVIENDSGKAIFSKEITSDINMSTNTVQIGVLTDDFNALNYFDSLGYYQNERYDEGMDIQVMNIRSDLIPEAYNGFAFFDILVISNYDTNKLKEEQYKTLKNWVNSGGILLLGTGASYQKTLGKFTDDYIIGTIGDLSTQSSTFGVDEMEEDILPISFDALNIHVEGGEVNEEMAFQAIHKGLGKVMVFDFDFGSSAFSDWKHNKLFFESILNAVIDDRTTIEGFYGEETSIDRWTLQNIISNTFFEKLPSMGYFVFIIVLYIILIPIVYAVLKIKDKRQWIWGVIPVLSMIFAFLIYGVGSNSRQKKPFLNYTSIISLENTGASETSYIATTSPQNKPYKFQIKGNYFLESIQEADDYGYYSADTVTAQKNYAVGINRSVEETIVEIKNAQAFGKKYFEATQFDQESKNVEIDITYTKDGYKGTITNHLDYDLTDVAIANTYNALKFGILKSGQTIKIEDGVEWKDYDMMEFLIPRDYTMSTYESGISSTKRSILTNFSSLPHTSNKMDYVFVGFADDYTPLFTEDIAYDVSGITLFKKNIVLGSSVDGSMFIPDIAYEFDNAIVSGEFNNYSGVQSMTGSEGVIEYTINEDITIDWIFMNEQYGSEGYFQIYFYNNETESYEEVFQNDQQLSIEVQPVESFINEEGILRIKYRMDASDIDYDSGDIPIFSAGVRVKEVAVE